MTPIPSSLTVFTMLNTVSISLEENDAVGSSRMMTVLLDTNALAISTIFC
jgi:hypothetical protein